MTRIYAALAIVILALMSRPAAADVAGSEDHPDIGRYQGSEILHYQVEDYGSTVFATGPVRQMVDASQMARSLQETGRVALYGIYFEHDSANLTPESKPTLDEIAAFMNAQAEQKVIVVGHTDYVGGFDYNIDLSKRRAGAVVDALVTDYAIAAERLKSDGVGYLAPAATNLSDTGRALNRRVELVQDK